MVEACNRAFRQNQEEVGSLCSLYKESQNTDEYASYVREDSFQSSQAKKLGISISTYIIRTAFHIASSSVIFSVKVSQPQPWDP